MESALSMLLGAALTWLWYFVQRRVERRDTSEAIERSTRLLALKRELDGAHTDLDDLRQFETRLIGKAETAMRIADRYVTQAENVTRFGLDEGAHHDDMNRQALEEFRAADARLARLVAHVRNELDEENRVAFERAQRAWIAFRECYARFVAQCYCGGALQPLIHAVTLESVTCAWINELETQLGDDEARWSRDPDPLASDSAAR